MPPIISFSTAEKTSTDSQSINDSTVSCQQNQPCTTTISHGQSYNPTNLICEISDSSDESSSSPDVHNSPREISSSPDPSAMSPHLVEMVKQALASVNASLDSTDSSSTSCDETPKESPRKNQNRSVRKKDESVLDSPLLAQNRSDDSVNESPQKDKNRSDEATDESPQKEQNRTDETTDVSSLKDLHRSDATAANKNIGVGKKAGSFHILKDSSKRMKMSEGIELDKTKTNKNKLIMKRMLEDTVQKENFREKRTLRERKLQEMKAKLENKLRKKDSKLGGEDDSIRSSQDSQPSPNTATIKERVLGTLNSVDEEVWVQCDSCDKWRRLPFCLDPSTLPDSWVCTMHPDKGCNTCETPEEDWKKQTEIFVYEQYVAGSVVWARMQHTPWWPAMVDIDPDYNHYIWLNIKALPTHYHVTFFGQPVTRAWVTPNNMKKFRSHHTHKKFTSELLRDEMVVFSLHSAVLDARIAYAMDIQDRRKKYAFVSRYSGKLGKRRSSAVAVTDKCRSSQIDNSTFTWKPSFRARKLVSQIQKVCSDNNSSNNKENLGTCDQNIDTVDNASRSAEGSEQVPQQEVTDASTSDMESEDSVKRELCSNDTTGNTNRLESCVFSEQCVKSSCEENQKDSNLEKQGEKTAAQKVSLDRKTKERKLKNVPTRPEEAEQPGKGEYEEGKDANSTKKEVVGDVTDQTKEIEDSDLSEETTGDGRDSSELEKQFEKDGSDSSEEIEREDSRGNKDKLDNGDGSNMTEKIEREDICGMTKELEGEDSNNITEEKEKGDSTDMTAGDNENMTEAVEREDNGDMTKELKRYDNSDRAEEVEGEDSNDMAVKINKEENSEATEEMEEDSSDRAREMGTQGEDSYSNKEMGTQNEDSDNSKEMDEECSTEKEMEEDRTDVTKAAATEEAGDSRKKYEMSESDTSEESEEEGEEKQSKDSESEDDEEGGDDREESGSESKQNGGDIEESDAEKEEY